MTWRTSRSKSHTTHTRLLACWRHAELNLLSMQMSESSHIADIMPFHAYRHGNI